MRLAPLSGVAAAVLLVGGLAESNIATSASDSSITSWLAQNHTGSWLAHAFLLALAAIAVLVFGSALRDRVAGLARSDETSTAGGSLVSAAGVVTAVALFTGAALFAAYPIGHLTEDMPLTSADGYRVTMAASASLMFVFSMLPAAALAVAAATVGLRRRTMPTWLAIFSYVFAALMIASALLVPFLAFGIWIIITSITLALTRPPAASPRSPVVQSLVTSR
jgi:hypothetical protein